MLDTILSTETTSEAYDNCLCEEAWAGTQLFIVEDEQVLGITGCWAVAITKEVTKAEGENNLHTFREDPRFSDHKQTYADSWDLDALDRIIPQAIEIANERGWELHDWVQVDNEDKAQ